MKNLFVKGTLFIFAWSLLSCNAFKLNSEKNCLNQQSNCFKWDMTNPTFVSATPTPNAQVATLPTVTLVFSEELQNGADINSYTLTGAGASGLKISTAKYLGNFTYQLALSGSILSSGPIKIDFSPLKDYKSKLENVISGQTSVQYQGNVSASVTASTNHNGLGLGVGGYPSITVTFQHDYATSSKNTWQVRVTNGLESCTAGTQVDSSPPSGANQYLAANTQAVSAAIPVSAFTIGTNRVVVCVQNQDNTSVLVVWSAIIIRDDTAPVVSTGTPISDSYGPGVQPFTVTCSDNAELIAVTTNSQTGSAPALPTAPSFDPVTGAITNGFAYTGPISIPNPTNPTYTNYSWLCRDIAGHTFASVQSRTYGIDINIPPVNVTLSGGYYSAVSNVAGSHANTTIAFTTDQVNPTQYKIIRGGTSCSDVAATNLVAPTALPATPLTTVSNLFPFGSFPVNGTAYDVRVCVRNAGNTLWGPAYLQIWRDDTVPVFAGINTLVNPNDGTINLFWLPATDTGGSGVEFYEICQSTTAGACGTTFTANYQTSGAATSYQVTGLSTSTTYYFMVRARDYAGNREANVVEKKSRLSLSVTVAGYSSAVPDFRVTEGSSTLSFTSSTTLTFSNVYTSGNAYAINVVNQPGGQNCAFIQNQFGVISADTTLNVTCVSGYLVTGNLNTNPPVKLNYRLYQGKNSTVAGSSGTPGAANGTGAAATFNFPEFLAHLNGSLYVSDTNNYKIRKVVTASNAVTTLAGTGAIGVGTSADDGPCATASLGAPMGVATDGTNLYVAEYNLGRIRKLADVNGTCQATTFAGTGTNGFADGPGTTAQFSGPRQIVINQDYIFVADNNNHRIRRVALATGIVDTLVGNGTATDSPGTGTGASIQNPDGVALIGSMLYATTANHRIMEINITTGVATLVAGDGIAGNVDALGVTARLNGPVSMTTDGTDLYVAEYYSHVIRRIEISKNYRVTMIAGAAGLPGDVTSAVGPIARFNIPHGIVTDGRNFFVTNHTAHTVRKLTDAGGIGYWPIVPSANPNDYNSDNGTLNNGTVNGGPLGTTTDRFGNANLASTFNGSSQYITAGAPITAGSACNVTMAAWYKPNALAANQGIVYNGNSGSSGFGLYFSTANGVQILLGGVTSIPTAGGFRPTVGQWVHLTARCQNGTWSLFANGHKVGEANASPTATAPAGLIIGRDSVSAYANGSIAEVRIYNRALNEGEINELSQDSTGTAVVGNSFNTGATGLLSHYEFTGGTPGAANLQASGPLGGTLGGSASSPAGKDGDASGSAYFIGSANLPGSATALPAGNAPRTMCAFFAPQSFPAGTFAYAVSYGDIAPPFSGFGIAIKDIGGGVYQIANTFSSGGDNLVTFNVPLNSWSHLCATYDGLTSSLYLNGKIMGTQPAALNTVLTSFKIGSWLNNSQYMQGNIDDVRIYNNALSQFQIRQLATQVPSGLVARYDFTGDFSDVSGYGQSLTNNGAVMDVDRFGAGSASVRLGSNAYLNGAMNGFPLGAAPRTICAWTNPNTLFPATFSEVVMYGVNGSGTGWGFGMDAAGGLPNGRIFVLDTAGDMIYAKPHGLNIWRHVCATYNGTTEQLFVDAYPVTSLSRGLNTATGQILIGMGIFGPGDYFNGNIDDVRVYNRVLSNAELQALLQQPNKRMVLSGTNNPGNQDGGGGISGADSLCLIAGSGYKALIVDGIARQACSSANCGTGGITENIDWVLRPNVTYLRSDNATPIQITNLNSVFTFPLINSVSTASTPFWTGFAPDWTTAAMCNNGGPWNAVTSGYNGIFGLADQTGTGLIYNFGPPGNGCNSLYNLVCVQQ